MYVMGLLKKDKVWVKSMLNTVVKAMLSVGYIKWGQVQERIGALRRFNIDLTQTSWKLEAGYGIIKLKLKIEGSCKYEVLSGNLYAWTLWTKEL